MKTFAVRFPLLFALATTLAASICLTWPLWISGLSPAGQMLLGRAAICLFAVFMLTYLGWWREVGFIRPKSWRILLPYLPVLLLIILLKTLDTVTVGIHVTDLKLILLGLVVYLAGGFMEEAIFRGLVLHTLLPGGLMRAAIISALIFGLAHFLNLAVGANLNDTILQVMIAFLLGLAFTAPLAVTGNIWPLVFIHAFNNFVGYLNKGGFLNTAATSKSPSIIEIVISLLPFLLLALYNLWLLRRAERRIDQRATVVGQQLVGNRVVGIDSQRC